MVSQTAVLSDQAHDVALEPAHEPSSLPLTWTALVHGDPAAGNGLNDPASTGKQGLVFAIGRRQEHGTEAAQHVSNILIRGHADRPLGDSLNLGELGVNPRPLPSQFAKPVLVLTDIFVRLGIRPENHLDLLGYPVTTAPEFLFL